MQVIYMTVVCKVNGESLPLLGVFGRCNPNVTTPNALPTISQTEIL